MHSSRAKTTNSTIKTDHMFCTFLGTKPIRDKNVYRSRFNNLLFLAVDGNSLNSNHHKQGEFYENNTELFNNKRFFLRTITVITACGGIALSAWTIQADKNVFLIFTESFASPKITYSPNTYYERIIGLPITSR